MTSFNGGNDEACLGFPPRSESFAYEPSVQVSSISSLSEFRYAEMNCFAAPASASSIRTGIRRTRISNSHHYHSAIKKSHTRWLLLMAGTTRLELATSCVTGMRSNQLSYAPIFNCHHNHLIRLPI